MPKFQSPTEPGQIGPDETQNPPGQQPLLPYPPQQGTEYSRYLPPMMKPPRKRRRWPWVILGAIVVLVVIVAFAARSGNSLPSATLPGSTSVATNAPTQASTPTPSSNVAQVGGTITVNDVAVTLGSAKILAGDEFTQPKAGNEFIVVHVKIVNNSASEIAYNPFDFHVRSGSGNITDEEFVTPSSYTANNALNSGKLSPGGNVEADIIFQVTKGDHKAQMTWQPSFFGNAGDNAWNLGL